MGTLLNSEQMNEYKVLSLEGVGTPHGKAFAMDRARRALLGHVQALQIAHDAVVAERDELLKEAELLKARLEGLVDETPPQDEPKGEEQ